MLTMLYWTDLFIFSNKAEKIYYLDNVRVSIVLIEAF